MRILRTGSERYFPAFLTFPDSQSGRAFWQSQHLFYKKAQRYGAEPIESWRLEKLFNTI